MSVTFYPTLGEVLGWDVTCVCGATYLEADQNLLSYDEAKNLVSILRVTGLANCEDSDCFTFGIFPSAIHAGGEGPTVNMSNGNSVAVLEALGLKTDEDDFSDVCCGSLSAEDFKGRVLMALAVAPISPERVTEVTNLPTGSTIVNCGREEGYLQEKLEQLLEVADFALEAARSVTWA